MGEKQTLRGSISPYRHYVPGYMVLCAEIFSRVTYIHAYMVPTEHLTFPGPAPTTGLESCFTSEKGWKHLGK